MKAQRILVGIALVALAVTASPLRAPRLLAFPYVVHVGADQVYSTVPLRASTIAPILARADRLVHASPLAARAEGRDIFLTGGDWRWTWLAGTSTGAFALTRPYSNAMIVNRADLTGDHVYNKAAIGGVRSLSGVIAHEKCHGMVRRHFGAARERMAPVWLREGYCDYIARESSLTDAQTDALEAAKSRHPAIAYVRGAPEGRGAARGQWRLGRCAFRPGAVTTHDCFPHLRGRRRSGGDKCLFSTLGWPA